MIDIKKPEQKPIVIIRAATGHELSNYEKRKLANIEDNAQENKIEAIRLNNQRLNIDPLNKEVRIDLGGLAFKSAVKPEDLSADDLFFIKCELSESDKTK
jgi:hypothetical protein